MIAFVCASPVQVMRAVHMKMRMELCNDSADIYIPYKCPGYKEIASNLEKISIFKNVYPVDKPIWKSHVAFHLLFGHSALSKMIRRKSYTKLFGFNIEDEVTFALFNLNRNKKNFEYHCVEDGPNIYRIYEPKRHPWYHPFKILGIKQQAYHITRWWSSCSEFIVLPSSFYTTIEKLPIISVHDEEYIKAIDSVFDYKEIPELENADVLIMDESHYVDGLMIDNADVSFYKEIQKRYPDKQFLVKMHPRTQENRYKTDFEIMRSTSLPWELYVLNRHSKNNKDLIQISIVCGTMLSDRFMFGVEGKKIILAPLFYDKVKVPANGTPRVSEVETRQYECVKTRYHKPEDFIIAYSKEDVYTGLDRMLMEGSSEGQK